MERSASGVDVATLAEEAHVLQLGAVEVSGDADLLTSDNNNLLSEKDLLGNNRCQATKKMVLSVNDQRLVDQTHVSCKKYT